MNVYWVINGYNFVCLTGKEGKKGGHHITGSAWVTWQNVLRGKVGGPTDLRWERCRCESGCGRCKWEIRLSFFFFSFFGKSYFRRNLIFYVLG